MREIKFRAWDKEKRFMHEPQSYIFNGMWHGGRKSSTCDLIVMQFTGLKDKQKGLLNGVTEQREEKEIYEGDIIANLDGKQQIIWKGIVEWSELGAEYKIMLIDSKEKYAWRSLGTGTKGNYPYGIVIGNIYENPELLTESKK